MADDPVTVRLGYLRACIEAAQVSPESFDLSALLGDMGRVVAALDRVLDIHYQSQRPADSGPDRGKYWCVGCYRDVDHHILYTPWPCPTYRAISAALPGEEGGDGG